MIDGHAKITPPRKVRAAGTPSGASKH